MTYPAVVAILCGFGALLFVPAQARLGETKEEFEHRLLQPFVGKFIPRDKNADPAQEAELLRQQPFNDLRVFFPSEIKERKYWKSAVAKQLSNDSGWRVHVFYLENRSVMEAYQRVGDSLSEFEIQNILKANQGGSGWNKTSPESMEGQASAIGYDYQLADGSLRAKVQGNWLMVFTTALDSMIVRQRRSAEETRAAAQEEQQKLRQAKAPESTSGF